MREIGPLILLGALLAAPLVAGGDPDPEEEAGREPELVGIVSREEIEATVPDWVEEEMTASPDPAAVAALPGALAGARLTVYLGTWCSDSRRELARFWRALDEAALVAPDGVTYVGVDRSKQEPREEVEGAGLRLVPTFVVSRGGVELGRVVEESPGGIENDLLALLTGERRGLITANPELLEELGPR